MSDIKLKHAIVTEEKCTPYHGDKIEAKRLVIQAAFEHIAENYIKTMPHTSELEISDCLGDDDTELFWDSISYGFRLVVYVNHNILYPAIAPL